MRSHESAVEIPTRLDSPKPKCSLQLTEDSRCAVGLCFDVGGELKVTREGDTNIFLCFYKFKSPSCAKLAHKEISVCVESLTRFAEFHDFAFDSICHLLDHSSSASRSFCREMRSDFQKFFFSTVLLLLITINFI